MADSLPSSTDITDSECEINEKNSDTIVEEPRVGLVFDNTDQLFEYYRAYGIRMGFGVSRRSSSKVDGSVTYVTVGCSRNSISKKTSKNIISPYPITKTNCKARLCAKKLEDGKWSTTTFVNEHNHALSPGKSRNYRCNRKLTPSVKRKLELNDRAGIRINKNFNSFIVEAGGHENLSFSERDCRNYIGRIRRLRLGEGDAIALQKYFTKVQAIDSNFFYTIDHDEDNRIRYLFWADARCRAAYEEFSDVISFDTTYLTNKYDMPFAPFVGVNNHGQSILLGCGLISSEDTETFIWLFQSWLTCMNFNSPKAIITDTDDGRRYDRMCNTFHSVADLAYDSDDRTNALINQLLCLQLQWNEGDKLSTNKSFEKEKSKLNEYLHSPLAKRRKGRPPFKRRQSKVEQIITKLKKKSNTMKTKAKVSSTTEIHADGNNIQSETQSSANFNIGLNSADGDILATEVLNICSSIII